MSDEACRQKDIVNALVRAAEALEHQHAQSLANDPSDYSAEFWAADAELIRAAIVKMSGKADEVKKYTPNNIANEMMADEAWHDSLWVREADHLAALTAERVRADRAEVREKTWHDAALEAKAERDALRERVARLVHGLTEARLFVRERFQKTRSHSESAQAVLVIEVIDTALEGK